MSTDNKTNATQMPPAAARKSPAQRQALSLSVAPHSVASGPRSTDPYNSSGSFDRTKNWARVGKR